VKLKLALFVAMLSGFVALGYELLWYRVVSFLTWGVASSFSFLLGAYLLGLALGSRASAWFCKDGAVTGDPRSLRVLALFVALANALSALVVPVFAWSAKFADYRVVLGASLGTVALGAAMLGSVLPLLAHFGIEPDDRAGARLSYVYLANIVGSAAGSLVTGLVLMDALTLHQIALVLALCGFGLVAILSIAGASGARFKTAGVVGALVLAVDAWFAAPRLYDKLWERLLYKDKYDGEYRFARVIENKSGVITVTADGVVYGGGAYDGILNTSIARDRNGIVRAYAVGALHPEPKNVLMIGLASGSWAQVIAHQPKLEKLTIVEINPGYLELIEQHPEVSSVLHNSKVSVVIDDGRRWLLRHDDAKFDFIVMNTTWHWRSNSTNLLSTEFMQLARAHLAPGGIFYFNTTSSADVQLTAARTFPYAMRVMNFIAASDAPFSFDRARWRSLLQSFTIDGRPALDLSAEGDRRLLEELTNYNDLEDRPALLARTSVEGRLITDDNMVPEWRQPLRYPEGP
jgi:spermidine synthase